MIKLSSYNYEYDCFGNLHRSVSYKEHGDLLEFYSTSIYIGGRFWGKELLEIEESDVNTFREAEDAKAVEIVSLITELIPNFGQAGSLLELGCGVGSLMHALLKSNLSLIGCDISNLAQPASVKIYGNNRFQILEGEAFELVSSTLLAKSWDYFVCIDFLEHIKTDNFLLSKLCEALSDTSKVIISVPIFNTNDFSKLIDEEFLYPQHHLHLYSESGLEGIFTKAQFKIISKARHRNDKKIMYILQKGTNP